MTKPHFRTRVCGHVVEAKRRNYYNPETKYRIIVDGIIIGKVAEKDLKRKVNRIKNLIRRHHKSEQLLQHLQ